MVDTETSVRWDGVLRCLHIVMYPSSTYGPDCFSLGLLLGPLCGRAGLYSSQDPGLVLCWPLCSLGTYTGDSSVKAPWPSRQVVFVF